MKKYILPVTAVLVLLAMLASCGKGTAENANIKEVYLKITESVSMPKETVELNVNDLTDYYGIKAEKVVEFAAVQDTCGYKDEIVIIKAADDASAKEIEALLNEHIEYQRDSMRNYDPSQYDILTSSEVITRGVYVAMFISAEQSTMSEIYNGFFK